MKQKRGKRKKDKGEQRAADCLKKTKQNKEPMAPACAARSPKKQESPPDCALVAVPQMFREELELALSKRNRCGSWEVEHKDSSFSFPPPFIPEENEILGFSKPLSLFYGKGN